MRESLEMYTASRMQHMVQIRKKNIYFVTNLPFCFFFEKVPLGLSALRAPTVWPLLPSVASGCLALPSVVPPVVSRRHSWLLDVSQCLSEQKKKVYENYLDDAF